MHTAFGYVALLALVGTAGRKVRHSNFSIRYSVVNFKLSHSNFSILYCVVDFKAERNALARQ